MILGLGSYLLIGLLLFGMPLIGLAMRLLFIVAVAKRQQAFLKEMQTRLPETPAQPPQLPLGQYGTVPPSFDPNNFHTPKGFVVNGHVVIPGMTPKWKR
jgi:hypothetical protein